MTTHNPPEFKGITTFLVLWRILLTFYHNDSIPIISKGYLSEDSLFILNAFVFALAPLKVKEDLTLKSYFNHLAKTLIHIYPILLISELSFYYFFGDPDFPSRYGNSCTFDNLFDHLTLIQVWKNPNTCNKLSWFLAVEWAGAVVFPLLHWVLQKKTKAQYVLFGAISYICLVLASRHYDWKNMNVVQGISAHIRFFTQAIIGYCLGNFYKLDRQRHISYDFLTITSISLTLYFSNDQPGPYTFDNKLNNEDGIIDTFIVVLISALPICLIKSLYQRQFFSLPILRTLGEISMAVLFTHGLVAEYARQNWRTTYANLFVYLSLCYILGYVVYTYYEAPVTNFLHNSTIFGEDVEEYQEVQEANGVNGYQDGANTSMVRSQGTQGSLVQSARSQGTGLMLNSVDKRNE